MFRVCVLFVEDGGIMGDGLWTQTTSMLTLRIRCSVWLASFMDHVGASYIVSAMNALTCVAVCSVAPLHACLAVCGRSWRGMLNSVRSSSDSQIVFTAVLAMIGSQLYVRMGVRMICSG